MNLYKIRNEILYLLYLSVICVEINFEVYLFKKNYKFL